MNFDVNNVKKQMACLQSQGKWNEALEVSYAYWRLHSDHCDACILFVSECYWLLKERPFFRDNPNEALWGMSSISWDFEDKMILVLKQGMRQFESNAEFQWRIGKLLSIDFLPMLKLADKEQDIPLVMNLGEQMLQQAHKLNPTSMIYELDAGVLPDGGGEWNKMIRDEMKSMDLQRNYSDDILRQSLEYALRQMT